MKDCAVLSKWPPMASMAMAAALILCSCAGSTPVQVQKEDSSKKDSTHRQDANPWEGFRPTPHLERASGIMFPAWLGGMPRVGDVSYDNPALGESVKYGGPWDSAPLADIYIYNLGHSPIEEGCDSDNAKNAFDLAVQDISGMAEKGAYKELKTVEADGRMDITCADGSRIKARTAKFLMLSDNGVALQSRLVLTGYKDNFLKVRFSWPESIGESGGKSFESFMEGLGLRLKRGDRTSVDPDERQAVMKAVEAVEERPLADGVIAMPALMAFARDSEDVTVVIDSEVMPWLEDEGCPHKDIMLAAFIAGNVRHQLEREVCKDATLQGLRSLFKVYSKIKAADKSFKVESIEEMMKLDAKGGLEKTLPKRTAE